MRADLPTGTVTFLFTDIEGSTKLLQEAGDAYAGMLAAHHRVLREVWSRYGGVEVGTQGDAFFVAFARASEAVAAATEALAALDDGPVRVRMGVHTGEPLLTETGYVGMDVHRAARIAAVAHGGQVVMSRSTRDLVDVDVRDLGEHRLKDLSAPERLFQLGQKQFPRVGTLFQTNLPVQSSPLVGRERELADITAFFDGGSRLVTLTGPGGSGKTRLAFHAAAELAHRFPGGVWFVQLAPLDDPTLVEPAIVQFAGVDFRERKPLLVLDNLEHLLPEVATLVGALEVPVLATSRERLALDHEQEYEVPSLSPADAQSLFMMRARRLVPAFEPDEHVREIADRLDGLPLAIELAAARVKVLTPGQINERLGQGLDLLKSGFRDAPQRHRTLRSTIEWSHDLLSANERQLFGRLGVFPASFDADCAEEVAGVSLDDLTGLVDRSLVRATREGRFFLLETIRAFASEKLAETNERDELLERLFHYLLWVFPLRRATAESERLARRRRFVDELPSTRLVLSWLLEQSRRANLLELTDRSQQYWEEIGARGEAYRWGEAALAAGDGPAETRLRVLATTALAGAATGHVERAMALAEEAVARARADGSPERLGYSLRCAAEVYGRAARMGEARLAYREALTLAEPGTEAEVSALHNFGEFELQGGNLDRASELLELALSAARAFPGAGHAPLTLHGLGDVALVRGDLEVAATCYREALAMGRSASVSGCFPYCLAGLSATAAAGGDSERAALLWGGLEQFDRNYGPMQPYERERYERLARDLDDELVGQGRTLGEDELLEYALASD